MSSEVTMQCSLCDHVGMPSRTSRVRSNMRKHRDKKFSIWECEKCRSLHCEKVENLASYYSDYPLRREIYGYFTKAWIKNIVVRLEKAGLKKTDRVLDYGCGNGFLIRFLRERGYTNCHGYDPYTDAFQDRKVLGASYNWVLCIDVIEHLERPKQLLTELSGYLNATGKLCVGTPRAEGVDLDRPNLHTLHLPCHIYVLSENILTQFGQDLRLIPKKIYRNWFRDSYWPFTSRKFFETFMRVSGDDMESAFERPRLHMFMLHPSLIVYALFGYFFFPKIEDNVMIVFAKN